MVPQTHLGFYRKFLRKCQSNKCYYIGNLFGNISRNLVSNFFKNFSSSSFGNSTENSFSKFYYKFLQKFLIFFSEISLDNSFGKFIRTLFEKIFENCPLLKIPKTSHLFLFLFIPQFLWECFWQNFWILRRKFFRELFWQLHKKFLGKDYYSGNYFGYFSGNMFINFLVISPAIFFGNFIENSFNTFF